MLQVGRITPGFLPAALRAFKFVADKFVEPFPVLILSTHLPKPALAGFGKWLGREDYSGLPALRPAGRTTCVQICSRQICRTFSGSHPVYPLTKTRIGGLW
jgi:hypothetical protein